MLVLIGNKNVELVWFMLIDKNECIIYIFGWIFES